MVVFFFQESGIIKFFQLFYIDLLYFIGNGEIGYFFVKWLYNGEWDSDISVVGWSFNLWQVMYYEILFFLSYVVF